MADFCNGMLFTAMSVVLLKAAIAKIFFALQTILIVLLVVLLAERQRVNLIKFLQLMVVHDSAVVVFFGAVITKVEILVGAVNFSTFILAIHALKLTLSKLLLISYSEVDLILHSIALYILKHEVVLKCIFLSLTLYQNGLSKADIFVDCAYLAKMQLAQQKSEGFVGFCERVNVNMTAIKKNFFRWYVFADYSVDILSIEICNLDDSICGEFLAIRLLTWNVSSLLVYL